MALNHTDFDRCFESIFCGRRQMIIVHKYHLGANVFHVCTVDSQNYYGDGYWLLDRKEWTFTRLEGRPGFTDADAMEAHRIFNAAFDNEQQEGAGKKVVEAELEKLPPKQRASVGLALMQITAP